MTQDDNNISRKISPASQELTRKLWDSLSPADRRDIENLVKAVPSETNLMRLLVELATRQYRTAFGNKHRVAIVGPTNVGKSTLLTS